MSDVADPRIGEQALRKGEIEITKLRAEARSAELGVLPKLPESIPAGRLDSGDKGSPVGVAAAYRALEAVAAEVDGMITDAATTVWIVSSDVATPARALFEAVDAALLRLDSELASAKELLSPRQGILPLPLIALSLATSMVGPIASLLATDTKIRATDVTMPFIAVAAPIARALRQRGVEVIVSGAPAPTDGSLISRLREVEGARDDLATQLAAYRRAQVDDPSARLVTAESKLDAVKLLVAECVKGMDPEKAQFDLLDEAAEGVADAKARIAEASAVVSQVSAVVADVTTVLAALTTAPSGSASPISVASLYGAAKGAHVLLLNPTYAGAESVYEDVKMQKDRGLHLGTAIVSFLLTAPDGTLVAAGNIAATDAATTTVGKPEITWSGSPTPVDLG